jgi:hypothetical protein
VRLRGKISDEICAHGDGASVRRLICRIARGTMGCPPQTLSLEGRRVGREVPRCAKSQGAGKRGWATRSDLRHAESGAHLAEKCGWMRRA